MNQAALHPDSVTADATAPGEVVRLCETDGAALRALLAGHRIALHAVPDGAEIPASYWGDGEAGVIGSTIYARGDTPLHSVLHTAAHLLCMSAERRATLHTDCGSDDAEEIAVCYRQVLLADELHGYGRHRLFRDMDAWGYHFRAGGARAWFETDADDAHQWLAARDLL